MAKENDAKEIFWVPEGQVKDFLTFILAINWKEKWLIGIMALHLLCFTAILLTRKYTNIQIAIFCTLSGIALLSERINALGAKYWRLFSSEQYFDSYGLFIMVILSGPIMFNCLTLVIIWLIEAGQLLIKTKRRQLLHVKDKSESKNNKKVKNE